MKCNDIKRSLLNPFRGERRQSAENQSNGWRFSVLNLRRTTFPGDLGTGNSNWPYSRRVGHAISSKNNTERLRFLAKQGAKSGAIVDEFSRKCLKVYNNENLNKAQQTARFREIINEYIASGKVHVDAPIFSDGDASLLQLVTAGGHHEIVDYLVTQLKADVHVKGGFATTPLHEAIWCGWDDDERCNETLRDIKTLIDAGANLRAENEAGETPLDVALSKLWLCDFGDNKDINLLIKRINLLVGVDGKYHSNMLNRNELTVTIKQGFHGTRPKEPYTPQRLAAIKHINQYLQAGAKIPLLSV